MNDFFPNSTLIDAQEAQEIDRQATEYYQIPSLSLMENAGFGIANSLAQENLSFQKKGLILCGPGNNGGDGFVVSRYLFEKKIPHDIVYVGDPSKLQGDAKVNALRLPSSYNVIQNSREWKRFLSSLQSAAWILDGLFGTGLNKNIEGIFKLVIEDLEKFSGKIFSIDIPSGLSANSGKKLGVVVKAHKTYTLHLPKRGLVFGPDSHYAGLIEVIPIGIPIEIEKKLQRSEFLISSSWFKKYFKPRLRNSHKGTYGHALTFASSYQKIGAGLLTARAALRIGAGLSTLALPDPAYQKIDPHFSEIMFHPFLAGWEYFLEINSKKMGPFLKNKKAIAVGPGMEVSEGGEKLLRYLIQQTRLPLILDADALNILSRAPQLLRKLKRENILLTPHPGEMQRLQKAFFYKQDLNREILSKSFTKKYKLHLLLKGYRSLIATPSGSLFVNSTGGPMLATAGSGDVLTGIILGLCTQGLPFFIALCAGIWIHGRAGNLLAEEKGESGVLAGDLIDFLPKVLKELQK